MAINTAAFEVGKGRRQILVLSEESELLLELETSFGALARGEVHCPPRPQISVPGHRFSLSLAAWQPGMQNRVQNS